MTHVTGAQATRNHWERDALIDRVLDALRQKGVDFATVTLDELASLDQFHPGGKPATERLGRLAGIQPGERVLDVGGGLGGPARTLVAMFGCQVDVLDLTESYIRAGEALTELVGMSDSVRFHHGSALDLPFVDGSFDVVWTQNSGMNIEDKESLYRGFWRIIRPGGRLAFQEPLAGPVQPVTFPQMWARDASTSFLLDPERLRARLERIGFTLLALEDVSGIAPLTVPPAPGAPPTLQKLVAGDDLPTINANSTRDVEEGRIVNVQAVFARL